MSKIRMLYIDDEKDLVEMIKFVGDSYGYEVVADTKWREEYLNEIESYDFILLDIMFPKENLTGYDICKEIRGKNSELPVYMFSARTLAEDKRMAKKVGANGFIEKPVAMSKLIDIVERETKGER